MLMSIRETGDLTLFIPKPSKEVQCGGLTRYTCPSICSANGVYPSVGVLEMSR